jgi:hemolysin D
MNALTPIAGQGEPRRNRRPSRRRSDQEFLAPALEILETPPSPVRTGLIIVICSLAVVALVWGWFGQVDIVAVANGKIEPRGKVKIVEPLLTGRVAAIRSRDGDVVHENQIVAELDTSELVSELEGLEHQQAALTAELLRLRTVLDRLGGLPSWSSRFAEPAIAWDTAAPDLARVEGGILHRDLASLRAKLASIESQIVQRQIDIAATGDTIAAQNRLVATLQTVASMRSALVDREAGSKADWLGAMQELEAQQVILATHIAQRADDAATLDVLKQEGQKVWDDFLADYAHTLSTTRQKLDDVAHKAEQARAQVGLMTLRSPIDGTVEASALTSLGQVVSTGQEVLRVVPTDAPIVIRAYLPNDEIGFVRAGQLATIKIAAFPFGQYGTLQGKVVAVGKDALGISAASDGSGAHGASVADATGALLFPVTVELASRSAVLNGVAVSLSAGMQVNVEINTGRRRILQYLFSPLVEVAGSALHER